MQTTTKPTTQAKPAKVLYPDLQAIGSPFFWLTAFFRDEAEVQAIQGLIEDQYKKKRRHPAAIPALYSAVDHLKNHQLRQSLAYMIEEGTLLFAHQDTTIFDQVVAA